MNGRETLCEHESGFRKSCIQEGMGRYQKRQNPSSLPSERSFNMPSKESISRHHYGTIVFISDRCSHPSRNRSCKSTPSLSEVQLGSQAFFAVAPKHPYFEYFDILSTRFGDVGSGCTDQLVAEYVLESSSKACVQG